MVAVPDFSAGGMENWGLIFFRETALLYDENLSSASDKRLVATLIAHELAHMVINSFIPDLKPLICQQTTTPVPYKKDTTGNN